MLCHLLNRGGIEKGPTDGRALCILLLEKVGGEGLLRGGGGRVGGDGIPAVTVDAATRGPGRLVHHQLLIAQEEGGTPRGSVGA